MDGSEGQGLLSVDLWIKASRYEYLQMKSQESRSLRLKAVENNYSDTASTKVPTQCQIFHSAASAASLPRQRPAARAEPMAFVWIFYFHSSLLLSCSV